MVEAKHIGVEKKSDDSFEVAIEYSNGFKVIISDCIVTPFPEDLNDIGESESWEMTVTLKRGDRAK